MTAFGDWESIYCCWIRNWIYKNYIIFSFFSSFSLRFMRTTGMYCRNARVRSVPSLFSPADDVTSKKGKKKERHMAHVGNWEKRREVGLKYQYYSSRPGVTHVSLFRACLCIRYTLHKTRNTLFAVTPADHCCLPHSFLDGHASILKAILYVL